MKVNLLPLALDSIRTDGGTQVRDQLDEAWVSELVELYRDGHEIDPVLVVVDASGGEERNWLADGFHRVEAKRRLGASTIMATVRTGSAATLDMAKMLASQANKNGRPLQPGEKRKAVLMARSTPEGGKMSVRDLALHCGVAKSWVAEVLAGRCPVPDSAVVEQLPPAYRPHIARLYARVDEALKADPSKPSTAVAKELDCDVGMVRRRRATLGLPTPSPVEQKSAPSTKAVEAILRADPNRKSAEISRETGATSTTIAKARERLGLPPARGVAYDAPSAPPRKGSDPRASADVIRLRPAAPTYSSMAVRDVAEMALRFSDADWNLMVEQRRARCEGAA